MRRPGAGDAAGWSGVVVVAVRALVVAVVVLTSVRTAGAQTLNLDVPKAPAAGEGTAVLALAGRVEEELRQMQAPSAPSPTGAGAGSATECQAVAFALRTVVRRLVLDLVRSGERLGEAGSVHVVTALRLWEDVGAIDELAERMSRPSGDDGEAGRSLVRAAEAFVGAVRGSGLADGAQPTSNANAALKIPESVAELDRFLRDAFAMLAQFAPGAEDGWLDNRERVGWVVGARWVVGSDTATSARARVDADQWTALVDRLAVAGVSAQTTDALREFGGILAEAEGHFSFFREAADTRRAIVAAAGCVVFDGPGPTPAWVAQGARERLVSAFDEGAFAVCARGMRDVGRARLDRLELAARMIEAAQSLDAVSAGKVGNDGALRKARQAVSDVLVMLADGAEPAIRGVERALTLVNARRAGGLPTEDALPRELRPAWRVVDESARNTEAALLDAIPRIASAGRGVAPGGGGRSPGGATPMADPALVATLASHQKTLDDLRSLAAVAEFIKQAAGGPEAPKGSGPSPPPSREAAAERRLVADRILKLAQEVAKSQATLQGRNPAMEALAQLAERIELMGEFPAEGELRAAVAAGAGADPSWGAMTGGKQAEVLALIDAKRMAYLAAWAKEEGAGGAPTSGRGGLPAARRPGTGSGGGAGAETSDQHAAVLRVLRSLLMAIDDVRIVRELADIPVGQNAERFRGVRAWPGAHVSELGLTLLLQDVEKELATIAEMAIDPAQTERARRMLTSFERGHTTLRLLARLEREARGLGLVGAPVFAQLASPPSRGSWMFVQRGDVAAVFRYLDEWAAATRDRDRRRVRELQGYVESVAERVMEGMGSAGER